MKRLIGIASIALIFLTLLCSGCKEEYHFLQEHSNIASIEIVSFKYWSTLSESPEEIVICQIKDTSEFLAEFSAIEFEAIHPPQNPKPTPTTVKITYSDGTYEAAYPSGTIVNRDGVLNFYGSGHLNEKQFYNLIEKYIGNTPVAAEYSFFDRETKIATIEIVNLGEFQQGELPETQNVICQINDYTTFLKDFSEVDCFISVKPPTDVSNNTKAIKITYSGGHYELIDAFGQTRSTGKSYAGAGYRYFDNTQFSNFIESYLTD